MGMVARRGGGRPPGECTGATWSPCFTAVNQAPVMQPCRLQEAEEILRAA